MSFKKWLDKNGQSLSGKTVVITGATGGLGRNISRSVLYLGGSLVMVNRSQERSKALKDQLLAEFPQGKVSYYLCDLEDARQVRSVCNALRQLPVDVLMLNAGTYAIPRALSFGGWDNVFTTNFLSHYFMVKELMPLLEQRRAKVVATGSISHRFNPSDPQDMDFAHHEGANDIYGNSKRYLMFSLTELLKDHPKVRFAIGHPGISFTGITAHYPPNLLKIVKPSMLLIFMHPEKACRSMVKAIFEDVAYLHWLGPWAFDIWGNPVDKPLTACPEQERQEIFHRAEEMYAQLSDMTSL